MPKYKFGGKNGKTIRLKEAEDLVVIRTNENIPVFKNLSSQSNRLSKNLVLIHSFPESNVHIFRCNGFEENSAKKIRNLVRKQFKKEDSIKFAGRVLLNKNGQLNLYTENIFVSFSSKLSENQCEKFIKEFDLEIIEKVIYDNNGYFLRAQSGTGHKVFDIAENLLAIEEVEYCHPEIIFQKNNKTIYSQQWHLKDCTFNGNQISEHVNVEAAWQITRGEGITIAIIDDGVDIDHPEFVGKITHPIDMGSNTNDPSPRSTGDRHGTSCAGVACAAGVSKASGVAPDAKLMPIRLLPGAGSRFEANAFVHAAQNGADVISCSWGPPDGPWYDPGHQAHTTMFTIPDSSRKAIDYAATYGRNGKGCIITWAAGNGRENTLYDGYASYHNVIAVAACNDRGKKSIYSDFGKSIYCSFPSNDFGYSLFNHPTPLTPGIWTTDIRGNAGYNSGYHGNDPEEGDAAGDFTASFGGTSSASPGAAGIIALMLSANPDLTLNQVKEFIKISCDKIDLADGNYNAEGHSIYYGYGRLNAFKAVQNAINVNSPLANSQINGKVGFKNYNVQLLSDTEVRTENDKDRIIGFSLKISPTIEGLGIKYFLVYNKKTPINASDGAYLSMNDRRRKAIGFAANLTGIRADEFDLNYFGLFDGNDEWEKASNGKFCGKKSGRGEALIGMRVNISKKNDANS